MSFFLFFLLLLHFYYKRRVETATVAFLEQSRKARLTGTVSTPSAYEFFTYYVELMRKKITVCP